MRTPSTSVIAVDADVAALRALVADVLPQLDDHTELIVVLADQADLVPFDDLGDERLVVVAAGPIGIAARLNVGLVIARGVAVHLVTSADVGVDHAALRAGARALHASAGCVASLPWAHATPVPDGQRRTDGVLADLLQRTAIDARGVVLRTDEVRALGGVDATLRRAILFDLLLRLLPGNAISFHASGARPGSPSSNADPAGDEPEPVESRAEHGFALLRAICDRGLDAWRATVADATGESEPDGGWTILATLLLRSGLPEAAPLAREALRRARDTGSDVPSYEDVARRAAEVEIRPHHAPATDGDAHVERHHEMPPVDDAARDAVHALAGTVRRTSAARRAISDGNRALASSASWLATELSLGRRAAESAFELAGQALAKLRLGKRARGFARLLTERVRQARPEVAAQRGDGAGREHAATRRGPRRERWLVLAGVPLDDIGGGQRSAQLARALSDAGALVSYVARFPRHESVDLGITVADGIEVLPWDRDALRTWLAGRDERLRVLVELPEGEVVAFAREAKRQGARILYDKIDDWAVCSWARWYSAAVEDELIALADDLVGSARALVRQLAAGGRTAHLIPNAVDTTRFFARERSDAPPTDLVRGDVTLVYAGSLWGEWFDWALLRALAERKRGWSINLIGDPPTWIDPLPANVHLLGLKPQAELPPYLGATDVCLIPFVPSPLVDAVSPLKVFEYLAMHRPVVAAPMPELEGLPYVFTARDVDDTIVAIERACATPPPVAELERFAASSSWAARVQQLRRLVAAPRISVIVLCRDNREVIGECIESLLRARGDAAYEIVVVDNGSRDGSLAILTQHASRGEITLLQNPVNGCASGRNLGIEASSGEIVVFLDSDQRALFPGWLDPALDVLRRHADVGAVGWTGGWFDEGGGRGATVEQLAERGTALEPGGFRTDVAYLGSGGLVVPRAVLRATRGFDEALDPTCFEDTDLSFQIRDAGYQLACCPAIGVDHRPHGSTGSLPEYAEIYRRNERYFLDKWRHRPAFFAVVPR